MGRRDAPPEGGGGGRGGRAAGAHGDARGARARGGPGERHRASPRAPPTRPPRASLFPPPAPAPSPPRRRPPRAGRHPAAAFQVLLVGALACTRCSRGPPGGGTPAGGPGRAAREGRRGGEWGPGVRSLPPSPLPQPLPPPRDAATPPPPPPPPPPSPRPGPGALEGGGWPHAGEQGASGVWSCAGARGLERLLATRAAFSRGTDRRRRRGRPPWGVGRPST